jgi:hypothetical protein
MRSAPHSVTAFGASLSANTGMPKLANSSSSSSYSRSNSSSKQAVERQDGDLGSERGCEAIDARTAVLQVFLSDHLVA